MERILDKTIVLAGCLLTAACFLVETSSGAEPAASDARLLTLAIAMLIAVLCSALTEAVSTPAGILALSGILRGGALRSRCARLRTACPL